MTLTVSDPDLHEHLDVTEPTVVRITASLPAEFDPVTAYAALATDEYAFLLESAPKTAAHDPEDAFQPTATPDRHARYSFLGYDPDAVITITDGTTTITSLRDTPATRFIDPGPGDTLDQLRGSLPNLPRNGFDESTDRPTLDGGLVGFLAYNAVYDLWLDDFGYTRPDDPTPDAEFVLTTHTITVDHHDDTATLVFTPIVTPDTNPATLIEDLSTEADRVRDTLTTATPPPQYPFHCTTTTAGDRDTYEAAVDNAKQAVRDGDIYQAVISRSHHYHGDIDPRSLYTSLRTTNPSPYMYLLAHDDRCIVGASPETLVSVHDDTITANPIAGTCPRGDSPVEDRRLAGEMLADDKERAEHTMLVDLARNDVRRVSQPGTVTVPEFMSVLKYSHVQHIESTVTATLTPDNDAFDAIRATFPAGTLAGAPKLRAMERIHDLESTPRGIYGGGVGYIDWTRDTDFAITIRTATITHDTHDTITVRAGAGIVADSTPAQEFAETNAKIDGVQTAIEALQHPPEEVQQ